MGAVYMYICVMFSYSFVLYTVDILHQAWPATTINFTI